MGRRECTLTFQSRHAYNNEAGLPELPTREKTGDGTKPKHPDAESMSRGSDNNHDPVLQVSLRVIRGLSSLHRQVVSDMADQALYDGLRMRDHAVQAGERQKRSARFATPDKHQRQSRTDRLKKAQEAEAEGPEDLGNTDIDHTAVQLGTVHPATGGGLTEGQPGNAADSTTAVESDADNGDDEFWEDHSTVQDDHQEAAKPAGRIRRTKEQIRSDRMHEKGAFQVKITRTAKWYVPMTPARTVLTSALKAQGLVCTQAPPCQADFPPQADCTDHSGH